MKIKTGRFMDKYPYIKVGTGPDWAVICPGSEDLLISDVKMARFYANLYKNLFPNNYSLLVIGYQPGMPEGTTPQMIADDFATIVEKETGPAVVLGISFGGFVAMANVITCVATEVLSSIKTPTIFLAGTRDQIFPPESCKKTVALIRGSKIEFFDGETHTLFIERTKACSKVIASFLSTMK
nr:alpha/beta hydrolase [Candidatus Sigynarchaeota archaeon]